MEREGLGALNIQPGGTGGEGGQRRMLVARLERTGAQQQPSPARREFLAVFAPCHMGFQVFWGFFFPASELSLPRGLGESPEARAGDWEAGLLGSVHCSRTEERGPNARFHCLSHFTALCLSFPTGNLKTYIKPHHTRVMTLCSRIILALH